MAENTNAKLQNALIYSIYVRNHTEEGTFLSIIPDLDRIKALGTDIIWFLPIHPIGIEGKKGSLGCPYANRDYRTVNPEYGSLEDFVMLVNEIHARGMLCMIDVVYNHTSPDSTLRRDHPDWFYLDAEGNFGNKIGDWDDVIDLDYDKLGLWTYQIETLTMWAKLVDGFRCDVASMIPMDFWRKARAAVERVHPNFIWLAETVHSPLAAEARALGYVSNTDYEMYDAFDMEYDYDIRLDFDAYRDGKTPLSTYLNMLNYQEAQMPPGYNKMRCLENHDQPRIASIIRNREALENYTAFLFFLKGTTLIYAGQEAADRNQPSLFDVDPVNWDNGCDLSPLMTRLATVHKYILDPDDSFRAESKDDHDIAICHRENRRAYKLGIFSLKGESTLLKVDLPDGTYRNEVNGQPVMVVNHVIALTGEPVIIRVEK